MIDNQPVVTGEPASALACRDALSLIAHDLRTSVAVISGFARALAGGEDSMSVQQRQTAIGAISRHAETLLTFTQDIMDVLQSEGGRLRLTREPVDIGACVTDTVEGIRQDFPGHRFGVDLGDSPLTAWADGRRVAQVLCNLVGNAAKYSPPGTLVRITAARGVDSVIVTVADWGPPLPADVAADPFTLAGSRTDRAGGNGLGLYLCRLIVESLGGRIWAESHSGMVVFGFLLPVAG